LIADLVHRTEEPWATYTRGHRITPEALANLLRKYDIRPQMNAQRSGRGYVSAHFEDAFGRYLPPPPLENPSNLSIPSIPSPYDPKNGLPPVKDAYTCTNNRYLRGPESEVSSNGEGGGLCQ
jgi:hypothetical protein